jgi:hypothetical protein
MVRKILKRLYIVQYKTFEVNNYHVKFHERRRLNPYNPLTYFVCISVIIIGLITHGIIGFWEQVDLRNPFKWR